MRKTCPYCGGKAVRRQPMVSPVFNKRLSNFPCESCGAAVRIPRTASLVSLVFKVLAIVGLFVSFWRLGTIGDAALGAQLLVRGFVAFAVVIIVAAIVEGAFMRVSKVKLPPTQAPAPPDVATQAAGHKRCAVCDQTYAAEYDACPFCARRNAAAIT